LQADLPREKEYMLRTDSKSSPEVKKTCGAIARVTRSFVLLNPRSVTITSGRDDGARRIPPSKRASIRWSVRGSAVYD